MALRNGTGLLKESNGARLFEGLNMGEIYGALRIRICLAAPEITVEDQSGIELLELLAALISEFGERPLEPQGAEDLFSWALLDLSAAGRLDPQSVGRCYAQAFFPLPAGYSRITLLHSGSSYAITLRAGSCSMTLTYQRCPASPRLVEGAAAVLALEMEGPYEELERLPSSGSELKKWAQRPIWSPACQCFEEALPHWYEHALELETKSRRG